MSASRRGDLETDAKTGKSKNKVSPHRMPDAHGRYVASDAKEGGKNPLPANRAPGTQPKPPTRNTR